MTFHFETDEQRRAFKWMQNEAEVDIRYFRNTYLGNITLFVENCVHEFDEKDHDEWLDDPDHWIWDMAIYFFPES